MTFVLAGDPARAGPGGPGLTALFIGQLPGRITDAKSPSGSEAEIHESHMASPSGDAGTDRPSPLAPMRTIAPIVVLRGLRSSETRRAYRRDVRHFFRFLRKKEGIPVCGDPGDDPDPTAGEVNSVTIEHIMEYVESLQGYSPRTIARHVSSLRGFFRRLHSVGVIRVNPAPPGLVQGPRVISERVTRTLEPDEVLRLLEAARQSGKRNFALIRLVVAAGLRRHEVGALRVEDLIEEGGRHYVRVHGKGGKDARVEVDEGTSVAVRTWLSDRKHETRAIFPNLVDGRPLSGDGVLRLVKRLAARAGLTGRITAHCLRHTFVTLTIREGITLDEVRQAARHSSAKTTLDYAAHISGNPAVCGVMARLFGPLDRKPVPGFHGRYTRVP